MTSSKLLVFLLASTSSLLPLAAHAQPEVCRKTDATGPLQVTATCMDAEFSQPVIDSRKALTEPVPVLKVSGHFEGTDARFNIYLPPRERWQGRFFQQVYPMTDGEASEQALRFGTDSGGYTVQAASTGGYRIDAAAAKFARAIAREYYGEPARRIYGYVYGGSGGSYMTIGALENTSGVWDGGVPYVIGTPTSIPNNFFLRAFARVVLGSEAQQIADAVRPGGSGNPFDGLESSQAEVLREVSSLGVPSRGWEDPSYLLGLEDSGGLLGFAGSVKQADPGYADDFWSKPGYLGTDPSPLGRIIQAARIDQVAQITQVIAGNDGNVAAIVLSAIAAQDGPVPLDLTLSTAQGTLVGEVKGRLDRTARTVTLASGNSPEVLAALRRGARLRMDNSWNLALTSYHRHQIPAPDFHAWDQFRSPDGKPIPPQRQSLLGEQISRSVTGGGTFTGHFVGKMIVISNLLDVDAFPWDADWYAGRVRAVRGSSTDGVLRVWQNDHADHLDGNVIASGSADGKDVRLIDYVGILQQAVRDVSTWVEQGIAPAPSTRYRVEDGQIVVPASAAARRGIQPVVTLTANGTQRVETRVGQPVELRGTAQVPPDVGRIVSARWSPTGSDAFEPSAISRSSKRISIRRRVTYDRPGTYYPVLLVTAHREGTLAPDVRQVQNLARVRIVVR
ncbi:MAG: hypothetical protein ABW048_01935 [Sphingobium sp.]